MQKLLDRKFCRPFIFKLSGSKHPNNLFLERGKAYFIFSIITLVGRSFIVFIRDFEQLKDFPFILKSCPQCLVTVIKTVRCESPPLTEIHIGNLRLRADYDHRRVNFGGREKVPLAYIHHKLHISQKLHIHRQPAKLRVTRICHQPLSELFLKKKRGTPKRRRPIHQFHHERGRYLIRNVGHNKVKPRKQGFHCIFFYNLQNQNPRVTLSSLSFYFWLRHFIKQVRCEVWYE